VDAPEVAELLPELDDTPLPWLKPELFELFEVELEEFLLEPVDPADLEPEVPAELELAPLVLLDPAVEAAL
jgi:hypothetical protein